MEWAYAFDLHCNGFVAIYGWVYVLQLFLLPIVMGKNWISLFIGNSIYFVAYVNPFQTSINLNLSPGSCNIFISYILD